MDRQDLPHSRTTEGTSWQREVHDAGWRFIQTAPAPEIQIAALRNPELEAVVAESVGVLVVEYERELVAA